MSGQRLKKNGNLRSNEEKKCGDLFVCAVCKRGHCYNCFGFVGLWLVEPITYKEL